jgi:hypothetical protein
MTYRVWSVGRSDTLSLE